MSEITQPSPAEVRQLLENSGLSREQFAELVHVSKLTIHKWVLPDDNQNHRGIPLAAWELLLLKLDKHPTKKLIDA
ncbi:transcriptional regulator [Paraburkholderia sediminicola]|uniref:helix-turn-helix domain-containing protein n=1 Tax=Paraburkholderia sediminicola TaxID=458836 RepID=UPI0038B78999